MSAFLAIVNLTLRSVIRSHVFQVLLCILIATIIALPLTVVGDGTALAQIQVSLKYCLGAVSFILSLSSIWLGCFIMSQDIESYQLHMVICKPISRFTIWLGKFTGILIIHTILLIISALLVYILVLCQFQDQMFLKYTQWPLLTIMGLSGLICILIKLIWLNNYFLKFLRIRFVKSDNKRHQISGFLLKSWLCSLVVLIISSFLFFALNWQFDRETFSLLDKAKIKSEVLVGRRVFMPVKPNMQKAVMAEYEKRVGLLPGKYKKFPEGKKHQMLFDIKEQLTSRLGEVPAGSSRLWEYEGLNPKNEYPLFLRYRAYLGKISSKKQRETMGSWGTRIYISERDVDNTETKKQAVRSVFATISPYPEKIMCGIFHETVIPPNAISPQGKASVGFINFDPQRKTIFFQTADGPKLLVKVSGFINNYCRGVLIIFLKLAFLTGLACALGGLVSSPIAIFTVISYLVIGSLVTYLRGIEKKAFEEGGGYVPALPFLDQIGNLIKKTLDLLMVPMQNFEVSHLLSGGELIEWCIIWNILFFNVILRGLPIILLGIWLFKRREMGLVIKK